MYLATAKFAYNNVAHKSTKHFPFFLEYSRNFRAKPNIIKEFSRQNFNNIFTARHQVQKQVKVTLKLTADWMKWYYNKKVFKVFFKVENRVLFNLKDYQTFKWALGFRYLNPFTVREQLFKVTFVLNLPLQYKAINSVFHI